MAISNKMATSNKVRPVNNASLFRLFAWVTGHATVLIVIYTMIKVTVLLLASARLQDQETLMSPPVIKGCSTKIVGTDAATDTPIPCDPTTTPVAKIPMENVELHTFFGVNLDNTGVSFYESIIIFVIISALNIPQLYVGLKLAEATDIMNCPRKSVSLAFLYQKTQLIVVAVELVFLGLVLFFVGNNLGGKGCYLFYTGMLGIFSKLVFLFVAGMFIDEQLQLISRQKKIVMVKSSSTNQWTSVRIPVNVWKQGDIVKIQMPPLVEDQKKVETV